MNTLTHRPYLVKLQIIACSDLAIRRREDAPSSPEQRQAQLLQSQLSPHELAYQESLIQEREAEIREIETGIHELAEIFRDLGTLVNQQGSMIGASSMEFIVHTVVDFLCAIIQKNKFL